MLQHHKYFAQNRSTTNSLSPAEIARKLIKPHNRWYTAHTAGVLTFTINPTTGKNKSPDSLPAQFSSQQMEEIRTALRELEKDVPLKFREIAPGSNTDLEFNPELFRRRYGYARGQLDDYAGNPDQEMIIGLSPENNKFAFTVRHEIVHALGLRHAYYLPNTSTQTVMSKNRNQKTFGPADIIALNMIYGRAGSHASFLYKSDYSVTKPKKPAGANTSSLKKTLSYAFMGSYYRDFRYNRVLRDTQATIARYGNKQGISFKVDVKKPDIVFEYFNPAVEYANTPAHVHMQYPLQYVSLRGQKIIRISQLSTPDVLDKYLTASLAQVEPEFFPDTLPGKDNQRAVLFSRSSPWSESELAPINRDDDTLMEEAQLNDEANYHVAPGKAEATGENAIGRHESALSLSGSDMLHEATVAFAPAQSINAWPYPLNPYSHQPSMALQICHEHILR